MVKKTEIEKVKNGEKRLVKAEFADVFVKVLDNGQIMRPIKSRFALYEKLNHIYKSQSAYGNKSAKYAITSDGYIHLNRVASISIMTPKTVVVDGREQCNPHIERNQTTRAIEAVNIRKIGIGYSPAGNIVVVDKTLFYNIYTYFIQSIQAKMKRVIWKDGKATDKKEYPDCARTGTKEDRPESGSWAFFPTIPPLGIWVNYEDQAILDCLDEHTQRQRFGDRIAQKIVERNILKDHPAIGISQVEMREEDKNKVGYVTVYGYRHDMGTEELGDIMTQAEKGSADLEVKKEVIKDVPEDEEKETVKEVAEEDGQKDKGNPATDKEPPADFKLESDSQ